MNKFGQPKQFVITVFDSILVKRSFDNNFCYNVVVVVAFQKYFQTTCINDKFLYKL